MYILTELIADCVKIISVDRQKLDLSYTFDTINSIFVEIIKFYEHKKYPSHGEIAILVDCAF